jgi:hypothetical protein
MLARVRKAIAAGVGAALTGLFTAAIQAGKTPGWPEVGAALLLGVGAGWATWRIPNRPATVPAADKRLVT